VDRRISCRASSSRHAQRPVSRHSRVVLVMEATQYRFERRRLWVGHGARAGASELPVAVASEDRDGVGHGSSQRTRSEHVAVERVSHQSRGRGNRGVGFHSVARRLRFAFWRPCGRLVIKQRVPQFSHGRREFLAGRSNHGRGSGTADSRCPDPRPLRQRTAPHTARSAKTSRRCARFPPGQVDR